MRRFAREDLGLPDLRTTDGVVGMPLPKGCGETVKIGKPERVIVIEPQKLPMPTPIPQPVKPAETPVRVPVRVA
jgi:hypothetical protein